MMYGRSSCETVCLRSPSSMTFWKHQVPVLSRELDPQGFEVVIDGRLAGELPEGVSTRPTKALGREPGAVEVSLRVAVRVNAGGLCEHVPPNDRRVRRDFFAAKGRHHL